MKHGLKPTRKQMALIKKRGLNQNNWLITKNLPDELHIMHRETRDERVIQT